MEEKNEEEADEGRPERINIDIMGNKKGKMKINIDSVIENLSILTDDQEVHHSLTRSFEESFNRQKHYNEGFMKENVDIEWLLNKENFMITYADKGIENEDIEIIYEAIVKPADDMEMRFKQSEELKGEMERCPTIHELNNAINRSKKGRQEVPQDSHIIC